MDINVRLTLEMQRTEFLRGESIAFELVLANESRSLLRDLPAFDPFSSAIRVLLERDGASRSADPLAPQRRDGRTPHPPLTRESANMHPGEQRRLSGDALAWFGELDHGDYRLRAECQSGAIDLRSDPVEFTIRASKTVFASTPRYGAQVRWAPLLTASVERAGERHCAMLQLQSRDLPPNAQSAWCIAELTEPVDLHAAVAARSEVARHHAVWLSKNRLSVAGIDPSDPHAAAVLEVKVPTAGRVLASPLSLPDGGVCVPLADARGERVTFAWLFSDADPILRELDLGPGRPLGPYVCFWEYDFWGHFAWSAVEGREVFYSRIPLADRGAAPSAPRPIHMARGPILRIEALLDQTTRARARTMFAETRPDGPPEEAIVGPPPEVVFWIAAVEDGRLTCTRVRVSGAAQIECSLTLPRAAPLHVAAGCVNRAQHLCLLLADAEGGLHYMSTEHASLTPLHELMSDEVVAQQIVGLIPGGDGGIAPWVFLRYLDPQAARVRYARIEPFRRGSPGETFE